MGAWLSYRKLSSLQQLPNSDYRAQLAGLYPLDYAFHFSLTSTNTTGDSRVTIIRDWFLTGAVISASLDPDDTAPGTSVRAQLYIGRYKQGAPLSDRPMVGTDEFGGQDTANLVSVTEAGMLARFLKVPLWIPPNTPLLLRAQNKDTSGSTNEIEVTLQGCGP